MGVARGLLRRVFSKSRSPSGAHDSKERASFDNKSRWSSVRIYLCGDEFNSVPEEDDLPSPHNSEPTVIQPVGEPSGDDEQNSQKIKAEENQENSPKKLLGEDAARSIQSAFRGFMARRRFKEMKRSAKGDHSEGIENLGAESMAASTEVQIDESFNNLKLGQEISAMQHLLHQKVHPPVFMVKEEWDDSTVSSNVSRMRIQNRLKATTRRERALAYAFSQQLRTCNTKKRANRPDQAEPDIGWSWLERWMATRQPESSSVEDNVSRNMDSISTERRLIVIKKRFDVAIEERESCDSNDVSVCFEGSNAPRRNPTSRYKPVKNRMKAARSIPRQRMMPDCHCSARSSKVSKKEIERGVEKDGQNKQEGQQNNQAEI